MSADNTLLRFTHSTKKNLTYTYIFQLSSPNNFNYKSFSYEAIGSEFISGLGDIERGFEDDLNIGLELTGTCKLTFNLNADIGNSETMNEFRRQILCEQLPYVVDTLFFGNIRIPMRLTVKKASKVIFDGVMAFKTQSEIKINNGVRSIDVEFTDIVRAAGEICRTDNDIMIPYLYNLINSTTDNQHVLHNIYSMALVNRYIQNSNVNHHVLMMPSYITWITPKKMLEIVGRFYALAYHILIRYLVSPTALHLLGQADLETNWVCFGGNPFLSQGPTGESRYCDNPVRGWTFNTQDIVNYIDGPDNPTITALTNDYLYMIAYVNIKGEDGTFSMSTVQDGFCTNGKDGGNLGTYKNLYEFVKSWARSFYHKVTAIHAATTPSGFYFDVRSPFEQLIVAPTVDIATQTVERAYDLKRGALASNYKVNIADATNGNEQSIELSYGLENDTTLEHEVSVQSGNKFVNTSDTHIGYTHGGWRNLINSSNPYTAIYYDGTSTMRNDIIKNRPERMLILGMVLDGGVASYFFKVNERCALHLVNTTDIILIDKPALPPFIALPYGGEDGSGYFDDAGSGFVNEGDARRDAKYDLFNAYQSESFNTIGQCALINQWNYAIFGRADTEIINITTRSITYSPANIGALIYDADGLGIDTIDNVSRFGVLTKIIENPFEGTVKLTILSVKL